MLNKLYLLGVVFILSSCASSSDEISNFNEQDYIASLKHNSCDNLLSEKDFLMKSQKRFSQEKEKSHTGSDIAASILSIGIPNNRTTGVSTSTFYSEKEKLTLKKINILNTLEKEKKCSIK